ncbi:murein hydrolase activator EnvC family protein [Pseudohaliea rubra]|uniref:Lipoprotein NlpD n=1 Tax=Pseudohaliea rubra DSM 19751 TaxID=1265313 RepID=A0A095VR90_9GAMM|nr:peptidoglycan DD-metalloendopeptidase family protein [Pseudohaliea rubra]KGE03900.1 Lipoprotein NlpD [Pseudohaliea rubra DSM 19751]
MARWRRAGPGLAAIALAASVAAAAADTVQDERATREKLEALNRAIDKIEDEQRRDESARDRLQAELREAETALARLTGRVVSIEGRIDELVQRLAALGEEQAILAARRDAQRTRIAAELRQAWATGGNSSLKLLLNQEDPETLARVLAYYRYIAAARSEALNSFRETLAELAAVEASAAARRDELDGERAALVNRQRELAGARDRRREAVAALVASIAERDAQLARLARDAEALEEVLGDIEAAIRDLAIPANYQPFTAARGSMPWPATGRHGNRFGLPRNQGKMRWRGITINAEAGSTVRAIHHGRVVYADWLRGSGLLLVLDHGEGYMSLYAHNQSLLKDVGDWVTAGTPLATVGASGGRERAALYFEIRQGGKPVDPAQWCRG